jgi:hypothetical protein
MEGYLIDSQRYQTEEFGEITKTKVSQTCMDRFGASRCKIDKVRGLEFNREKLEKIGKNYEKIKTIDIIDTKPIGDTSDTLYTFTDRLPETREIKPSSLSNLMTENSQNLSENLAVDNPSSFQEVSEVSEVSENE